MNTFNIIITFSFQELHSLIKYMLKVNPSERPFIEKVIEKTQDFKNKIDMVV